MLDWLDANSVDFATGMLKNAALERLFLSAINAARRDYQRRLERAKWNPQEGDPTLVPYAILHRFRETVLVGTRWEPSTFEEIRLRLLKVAGRLEILKTRVKRHLSTALAESSALKIGGVPASLCPGTGKNGVRCAFRCLGVHLGVHLGVSVGIPARIFAETTAEPSLRE